MTGERVRAFSHLWTSAYTVPPEWSSLPSSINLSVLSITLSRRSILLLSSHILKIWVWCTKNPQLFLPWHSSHRAVIPSSLVCLPHETVASWRARQFPYSAPHALCLAECQTHRWTQHLPVNTSEGACFAHTVTYSFRSCSVLVPMRQWVTKVSNRWLRTVADVSLLLSWQQGMRGSAPTVTLAVGIERNQQLTAEVKRPRREVQ